MSFLKKGGTVLFCALTMLAMNQSAMASECGLSCCVAAGVDGVGSHVGLSLTAQYERMIMKDIRQGTNKISPTSVINNNMATRATPMMGQTMPMYMVPTKMVMQKFSANAAYRIDEDNAFVLTVPYVVNDMDMQMGMKMMSGMVQKSTMKMDTVSGLGDISLIYLRDIYKDNDIQTRQRFSLGIGVKAPTGKSTARNSAGQNKGELIHMMMQAGTGSWDGLLLANGTLGFGTADDGGAQWMLSPSLIYQLNGRNKLGYQSGDRLNYDLSARYRVTSEFNVKLDFNGVWAGEDSSNGEVDTASPKKLTAYQNPMMSMLDDVKNTGIHSMFISPGFQWVVSPEFNVSAEYRVPVYQNTTGTQIVVNNWYFVRASVRF
ncbi:MAG: transporter [Mariprofundaceae bacterium]